MTKKITFVLFLSSVLAHGQDLLVMKSVTENATTTNYFSRVNTTNGTLLDSHQINTNGTGTPNSPVYDSYNTIYSFKGRQISKHDVDDFSDCTSLGGDLNALYPYFQLVLINNRLFATKFYNTHDFYYELTLYELNINDGTIIDTHIWTVLYSTNGSGISFSSAAHELFIVFGNNLTKYNILTQELNTVVLPGTDLNTMYAGVLYADNRLFIRKKQVINFVAYHYIIELDKDTGAEIASHQLNSIPQIFSPLSSFVYLAHTKEIAAMYYGLFSAENDNIVVKYNIDTNEESLLYLPTEMTTESRTETYGRLVSLDTQERLDLESFGQDRDNKIKAVYNLLGQKVPFETYNQVLIIVYENGEVVKKVNIRD